MQFNQHLDIEGKHAFLSPSGPSWLNYDKSKLLTYFDNMRAKERGTEDHAFAALCIQRKQKIYRSHNENLANYINDSVDLKMTPEVVLYYSGYCFGTADAISFFNNELRIHDLKTGVTNAKIEQLEVYAALFCLEYKVDPYSIYIELRIYQYSEVSIYNPDPERIKWIMDTIIEFDLSLKNYMEMRTDA